MDLEKKLKVFFSPLLVHTFHFAILFQFLLFSISVLDMSFLSLFFFFISHVIFKMKLKFKERKEKTRTPKKKKN